MARNGSIPKNALDLLLTVTAEAHCPSLAGGLQVRSDSRYPRHRQRAELLRLIVEAGLVFHSGRGAVYYPPMTSVAKLMSRHDRRMSRLGQMGAAFLTVRAEKPG